LKLACVCMVLLSNIVRVVHILCLVEYSFVYLVV
jgi:hypothetical protein